MAPNEQLSKLCRKLCWKLCRKRQGQGQNRQSSFRQRGWPPGGDISNGGSINDAFPSPLPSPTGERKKHLPRWFQTKCFEPCQTLAQWLTLLGERAGVRG